MTKRMLIDATHAEETRVVVLDGNRLEDFDVETSTKKQLKGNIYLAKIVRVEPSLQAAFVEYGGGRHGFLAFGEIHPDYYQIPVADRQRLLAMQAEEAREDEEAEEAAERALARQGPRETRTAEPQSAPGPLSHAADAGERDRPLAQGHDGPDSPSPDTSWDDSQSALTAHTSDYAAPDAPEHEHAADEPLAAELDGQEPGMPEAVTPEDGTPELAGHEARASGPEAMAPDEGAPSEAHHDDDAPRRPAQPATIVQDVRFGEAGAAPGGYSDGFAPEAGDVESSLVQADLAAPGPDDAGFAGDASIEAFGGFGDDVDAPEQDAPPSDVPPPETIGGETDTYDGAAEARARRASRLLRNYRIQEVIRRRQIMLIQVVKEERGTKGAALTTYISLAGRYCVLMPNSPRGGGISRKITSASDRRRLKEITTELEIPRGMGLIVRTAGAARPKPEIKRDCEYLMRLWDDIREHTLKSIAPALIYEEASLIKRAIRDVYSRDVEEILVDGEQGWRAAHDFMRMLMPSHAKKVQLWGANPSSGGQPLFSRQGVEAQLDAMLSPTVQLRSGGYLVLAQTEALVSIDVNSGRSTRERGIEETALKTNLEAADEVARQLRLRDLAGLIVIDFIDMESRKANAAVERRLKDALKNDRARIQVGHISHFGLLEMSRQRLRPSLAETSFVACPHCGGVGHVRSIESSAIHVLRALEDEGAKQRAAQVMVHCAAPVTLYLLNHKRDRLGEIETRHAMAVHFTPDDTLIAPAIRIDRVRPQVPDAERRAFAPVIPAAPAFQAEAEEEFDEQDEAADGVAETWVETGVETGVETAVETGGEAGSRAARTAEAPPRPGETAEEAQRRRRRRRRRGGRRELSGAEGDETGRGDVAGDRQDAAEPAVAGMSEFASVAQAERAEPALAIADAPAAGTEPVADAQPAVDPTEFDENGLPQPRGPRRSRRGGRRRRRFGEAGEGTEAAAPDAEAGQSSTPIAAFEAPAYSGPTPADPYGGQLFDIYDIMDQPLDIPPVPSNARAPGDVEPVVEPPPPGQHAALVAPVAVEPPAPMTDGRAASGAEPEGAAPSAERPEIEHSVAAEVEAEAPRAPVDAGPADGLAQSDAAVVDAEATPVPDKPEMPPVEHAAAALADDEATPAPETELPTVPDPSVIQPVVVGKDTAAPGGKRGWWRA